MTKAEIVSKISEKTGIEKTTTLAVVESLMAEIKDSIKNEESVFLRGFGTFLAKERKEKTEEGIVSSANLAWIILSRQAFLRGSKDILHPESNPVSLESQNVPHSSFNS